MGIIDRLTKNAVVYPLQMSEVDKRAYALFLQQRQQQLLQQENEMSKKQTPEEKQATLAEAEQLYNLHNPPAQEHKRVDRPSPESLARLNAQPEPLGDSVTDLNPTDADMKCDCLNRCGDDPRIGRGEPVLCARQARREELVREADKPKPIDWTKPVWLKGSHQPVEVITTKARGDYPVIAYIGDESYVYHFTIYGVRNDGLAAAENAPEMDIVWINIWATGLMHGDKYTASVHMSEGESKAMAQTRRCVMHGIRVEVPK